MMWARKQESITTLHENLWLDLLQGPCRIITSQVTSSLVPITIHADVLTYFELLYPPYKQVKFDKMLSYQYKENTYKTYMTMQIPKFTICFWLKYQKKKLKC